MPAILTMGATSLAPTALSAYTSDQAGGSILHDILGRRDPDVTFRPAGLRSGSFVLDFPTEALSGSARVALSAAGGWTLTHSERTSINMRFVVRNVSRPLEADGRWMIQVQYEEIP